MVDTNIEIIASGTLFLQVFIQSCALLGYYAAGSGNSLRTFRDNLSVPSSRVKISWSFRMGPIDSLEMSVRNYHYTLRNSPEEGGSRLLRSGSLKSGIGLYWVRQSKYSLFRNTFSYKKLGCSSWSCSMRSVSECEVYDGHNDSLMGQVVLRELLIPVLLLFYWLTN